MPELPELQIYARNLNERFSGKTLVDCVIRPTKRANVPTGQLASAIVDSDLTEIERSGKEIVFKFSNGQSLAVHLMLKGFFAITSDDQLEPKYQRASFVFPEGQGLHVCDPRGLVTFTLNPKSATAPDALSADITSDYLSERFGRVPGMNVKAFLVDQDEIRGIGNAYSDEILWKCRIAPQSRCGKLPPEAVVSLAAAIHEVLEDAIEQVSDGARDTEKYEELRGFLKVHDPEKKLSPTGVPIKSITVGGRTTYFTEEQTVYD